MGNRWTDAGLQVARDLRCGSNEELSMTFNPRARMYGFCLALAGALALGGGTHAQTPAKPGMDQGMPGGMMADRQKMMADMQASQKKLDDLVTAMNAARGADKVDRLAAVVTELTAQHRQMGMRMMSTGGMQMPMMQPAAAAAPKAPADKGPTEEDHAAHHPKP
jgi:hypothetical protein